MNPLTRTRIKFCGLTRAADVDAAVALGVDAIGLILVPESARALTLQAATALRRRVPPFVTTVVLLRNADADTVRAAIGAIGPDLLQFHGEETPEYCRGFGHRYLKAVAMRGADAAVLDRAAVDYADATGLLLDGHAPGALGGQGQAFDWTRIAGGAHPGPPHLLAGGLTPDTVEQAIRIARPYAVDVSSGIETDPRAAPGRKDSGKMRAFVAAVRRADPSSHD